jgi:quercetin dioxygenase-like cupin family protein
MTTPTITEPVVVTAEDIDRLPTVALPAIGTGVSNRVLWETANAVGGLMRIRAHGLVDEHVHEEASHDIWIVEGSCDTVGQHLPAGSYVHIPPGVPHGIDAGSTGCTLLYLFRRS